MTCLSLKRILAASALALTLALGGGFANGAEKLGSYPVDAKKVSISGISSGAFMANQFHIAHSALIMGAGMVAGGLYACAVDGIEGDHLRALDTLATGPCMSQPDGLERVGTYKARVKEFARRGWIDPLEGLKGDRVYLFTGLADKVVNPETVHRAAQLYLSLGVANEDLKLVDGDRFTGKGAGHSWVTVAYGGPCEANATPYIDACGYDQAGEILHHIYGKLKPRSRSLSGKFVEFAQAEFAPHGKTGREWPERGRLPLCPEGLRAGRRREMRAACRLARLHAVRRAPGRRVLQERRPQRVGRQQRHHRPLPASAHGLEPATSPPNS